MAKKEFPEKELLKGESLPELDGLGEPLGAGSNFKASLLSKLSAFLNKAFAVTKFLLGIALLPFVFSVSVSFLHQFGFIARQLQQAFWNGMISFLAIYLFIWEPAAIYKKGHRILELIFNFFKPLVKVAPFLLPVYTILVFAFYGLLSFWISAPWLTQYTLFLAAFTMILHLTFSAKNIRGKKGDFLKGNYIFGFSFIYILNLALLAFCLNLIFKEFSFVDFCNVSYTIARHIFYVLFRQLFMF